MKIELKYEIILFYIHNVDECRDILLHCNILCSQLSFTANMKNKTLVCLLKSGNKVVEVG
jgi:hypothetical protein